MAIPLKYDATAEEFSQMASADALEIDVISRRGAGGTDLTVGANLGADELQLGSTTGIARVMHDLQVDGHAYLDAVQSHGNMGATETIDWTLGNVHSGTLDANCTISFTAPSGPADLTLILTQDATGGRTVTWPTIEWHGGAEPSLSTAATAIDVIRLTYDGTTYYGTAATEEVDPVVVGPASSTDNAIARWDGAGGQTLQDGGPRITDADEIIGDRLATISPTSLAANANDYDPTSFGTAKHVRQDASTAVTITGFAAPGAGDSDYFWFTSISSSTITLGDENVGSSAANRIATHTGSDLALANEESALLKYDGTTQRWRVVSVAVAAGSGDVSGPASSTDNHLVRFNGTSGKTIQDGTSATLDDSSNLTGVNNLQLTGHGYYDDVVDNGNSGAADTITWTAGNLQKSTLTAACTYTFTAPTGPCTLNLIVIQDATGGRAITWPAAVDWPEGTAPDFSTMAANEVTVVTFLYDGTNYLAQVPLDSNGDPAPFS